MNKKIIKTAKIKVNNLIEKYDGFNNVILDNWRGYRFIFDAENFLKDKRNKKKYRLSKILKNEKRGYFNGGLLLASKKDKRIFGRQKYLNCKTLEEYKNCYLNFIKKINNKKELKDELLLVKNLCLIYSKNRNPAKLEKKLKKDILKSTVVKRKINNLKILN
jgi:hypothetical protein